MSLETIILEKWKFALGESEQCLEKAREVNIPHTWNIEDGTEEYWGIGWYSYTFDADKNWKDKRVLVNFGAVYHDAFIYLNGQKIGEHKNSGYTSFKMELTENLKYDEKNILIVKVDNQFNYEMLPACRSFDWSNDGGLIRKVELQIFGKCIISEPEINSAPIILKSERQNQGSAVFGFKAKIDGNQNKELFFKWRLLEKQSDNENKVIYNGEERVLDHIEIQQRIIENIKYWHFDDTNLYMLKGELINDGNIEDSISISFGFKDFHIKNEQFYLNGEAVRICGTEWMPGSDPNFGSAETKEQLEKMLKLLKETNCVFTRFHWQQDDWVYDWCDEHGIMVQEEVPFWGKDPVDIGEKELKIFKQQIKEMVISHRNHPSIIMWGVGNELDGQNADTKQYIKDAVAYTHIIDKYRPTNYVSNTWIEDPALDGTIYGDVIMINDYIGTWHGDIGQEKMFDWLTKTNPDKAIVPAEFGLCEPAHTGGDVRRIQIFLEKMECYRKYPSIAGTINFCLNDYRTQMGEDGKGKLKKRVHGSTGLTGELKPSYFVVRDECSPLIVENEKNKIEFICRDNLPSYTVEGYYVEVEDGDDTQIFELPKLKPGNSHSIKIDSLDMKKFTIYRKNGDKVFEKEC